MKMYSKVLKVNMERVQGRGITTYEFTFVDDFTLSVVGETGKVYYVDLPARYTDEELYEICSEFITEMMN